MNDQVDLAIAYDPGAFETTGRAIFGRLSAGEGFIRAFIRDTEPDRLHCYADTTDAFESFQSLVSNIKGQPAGHWIDRGNPALLARPGALFWPSPTIAREAWRRPMNTPDTYSLVGVTHSLSSLPTLDAITAWSTAPVQDYDAVVCTSNAARTVILRLLDGEEEHLRARLGATRLIRPQLPVIPLGVDTDVIRPDPAGRARARQALGIPDVDTPVVLMLGRIDRQTKTHPVPMLLAVQRAAASLKRTIHLVVAGWFASKQEFDDFPAQVAALDPGIEVTIVEAPSAAGKLAALQAADMFLSLSDNLQETFGLTVIEAMAAGLPSVVSDWNGYKDTIRNGIDGYRISSFMPGCSTGADVMAGYETGRLDYERYAGACAARVAIDVGAASAAIAELCRNPDLRLTMGASARARAVAVFDWRPIVELYHQLARHLAERRSARVIGNTGDITRAERLAPFVTFAGYGTSSIGPETIVSLIASVRDIPAGVGSGYLQMTDDAHPVLTSVIGTSSVSFAEIVAGCPEMLPADVEGAVLKLAKFGVVRLS